MAIIILEKVPKNNNNNAQPKFTQSWERKVWKSNIQLKLWDCKNILGSNAWNGGLASGGLYDKKVPER